MKRRQGELEMKLERESSEGKEMSGEVEKKRQGDSWSG